MGRRSPLCVDGLGCRTPRSLPARFRPRSLRDGGHLDCTARNAAKIADRGLLKISCKPIRKGTMRDRPGAHRRALPYRDRHP